ncbi:MAG: nuclear transport factor 2 family protein [Chloroflexota bacterium]
MAAITEQDVRAWFDELVACVAAVDYPRGRTLFASDAIGFGTYGAMLEGLDSLQSGQWQNIWPRTRDFAFRPDSIRWGADGETAWGLGLWTSTGFDPEGKPFPRYGRATVIFARRQGRLVALHTHLSLDPRPSATNY